MAKEKMKRNLVIYEGSAANYKGDGALLYDIGGDLLDFKFSQKSNYDIDTFYAKIANNNYDIDINDVWRCYDEGGVLIGSGYIEKEPVADKEGNLEISGYGWTGILTRRLIENVSYSATDGDNIFKDILTDHFSDYSINTAEVADSTGDITNTYTNRYAFDIMKEVASCSYGASNRQFDFYLYESTAGTLKAKFFERGSGTATTIYSGDIDFRDFNLQKRQDINFNHVVVKGALVNTVLTPNDKDYWTEYTDDAGVQAVWTATNGTRVHNDSGYVGNKCVELNCTGGASVGTLGLNLTDADAYVSAAVTPDLVSEDGYNQIGDGSNQYLVFWINSTRTIDLIFSIVTDNYAYSGIPLITGAGWTKYEFNLQETCGDNWANVQSLAWDIPQAPADMYLYVDGVYFYRLIQVRGESPAIGDVTAPVKTYFYNDNELKTNTECSTLAASILKEASQSPYEGSLTLSAENTAIRAGSIVTIDYPQRNLVLTGVPVQEIEWGMNSQKLMLGRHRSLSEIINDAKNEMRRKTGK